MWRTPNTTTFGAHLELVSATEDICSTMAWSKLSLAWVSTLAAWSLFTAERFSIPWMPFRSFRQGPVERPCLWLQGIVQVGSWNGYAMLCTQDHAGMKKAIFAARRLWLSECSFSYLFNLSNASVWAHSASSVCFRAFLSSSCTKNHSWKCINHIESSWNIMKHIMTR